MLKIGATQLPPVFTHADAIAAGISDRTLYRSRDKGDLTQVARGIFAAPTLVADFDRIEIAIRAPEATLCLTTALAHHDLTDDIPPVINVALPRSRRAPRTSAPTKWHRFDDDTFHIGRETLKVTDMISIGIYSPTRSVIDAYRLRHIYGVDQAHAALKRWLRRDPTQPSELLAIANNFPRAKSAILSTLEVLL